MVLKYCAVLLVALALVRAEPMRFDNYRVYTVKVENDDQLKALKELETGPYKYEFIDEPMRTGHNVDLIVPPTYQDQFENLIKTEAMKAELSIPNLQTLIDKERPMKMGRAAEDFNWEGYHSSETMFEWLQWLADTYDEVTLIKGGDTSEGREIIGVNINRKPGQNPGVFIEANIHAREWITSASTTWIINKLLTADAVTEPGIRDIADNINWYIFPLVNVDGYEYSREHYRLWRKTRSKLGYICIGTDPNRNWDSYWEKGGIGSSGNLCDITYAGPEVFSEVETRTLSNYALSLRDNLSFYLAFHSAAQMILSPWGHTYDLIPEHDDFMDLMTTAVTALTSRYGVEYTFGPTITTIYPTTGTSSDWAYYAMGIPGFTYEFRGHDPETGERYSFTAPPDQIQPNAEEVLDSLVAMFVRARELGYLHAPDTPVDTRK